MPISMNTLTKETMPIYLEQLKKCGASRVFFGGMGLIYTKLGRIYTESERIKETVEYFRSAGFEVGLWSGTLGNGHSLTVEGRLLEGLNFTQITGIAGEAKPKLSNCPLDENFVKACQDGMRQIASFNPDLIMIDDDLRFYGRMGVRFPCFCPLHLREYYKRIGKEIPREELERTILTGGESKYRTELLKLFGESFIGFAKSLRAAVDEVNPNIRLGQCTFETWDMMGTDPIEISKALAGGTKPFVRISGAPFRDPNIIHITEFSRQQFAWGRDSGVEMFAEGDVYPRPRSGVPSRPLELFELLLTADGTSDGMLAYLFDYNSKPTYETGYVDRYVRNSRTRDTLREMFAGKRPVGVEVAGFAHKAETWELPTEFQPKALELMLGAVKPASAELLSNNSIPTAFAPQKDYPLLIIGENARHVDLSVLSRGAIIDVNAAMILKERGVDTGLISAEITEADREYFPKYDDSVPVFGPIAKKEVLYKIECSDKADVRSLLTPLNTPGSYRYENASGERFLVLSIDHFKTIIKSRIKAFDSGYYRQAELYDGVEWLCGKRLPAFTAKCPNLYILSSKGEGAMSVALANVSLDPAYEPVIVLDKAYSSIKFLDCSGRLEGDRVYLSDITSYGFCAFEVK